MVGIPPALNADRQQAFGRANIDIGSRGRTVASIRRGAAKPSCGVRGKKPRVGRLRSLTSSTGQGLPTHHGGAEVGEGHVIVGASAASFPNSSGANARTVVVRAFPDVVIATAN
jgi:hypothetical protein